MLVCASADLVTKLIGKGRRFTRATLFDVSQLALSYGLAAALFRPLNRPDAAPLATAALAAGIARDLLPDQHGARLHVPRARPAGRAGPAGPDRPLPASGPAAARPDRGPRSPRLRPLRHGGPAAHFLPGRARLPRHAQSLDDGEEAPPRRPGEPGPRGHARDLEHLCGRRARRPVRTGLHGPAQARSGRGHGARRMGGRPVSRR